MLGLDVCEFGGQVLELLWLTVCYRGLMADNNDFAIEEDEDEKKLNYIPPAQKSLMEIQEMDKEDESLVKYKNTLLGLVPVASDVSVPNVQVSRMTLLCDEAPEPITVDLTGDLKAIKEQSLVLKEGAKYRIKIEFKVSREIVAGLRYNHVVRRKGIIAVDKKSYMVGSYGPKAEAHTFLSPVNDAPIGILARGRYEIHSRFSDDDRNVILDWEWNLDVNKDWN
ncbi:rho GDP-dissociation inhibitor 3 isoform X1 [Chaetodon trifascialis]|uniref:rho GDP-dissociation inhibitor 3 isoform X1 n=1 Tax=Chaetodon trifascialis TaxID=109706 RepID=UPI003991E226